jgi:hypothetical protein
MNLLIYCMLFLENISLRKCYSITKAVVNNILAVSEEIGLSSHLVELAAP